MREPPCRTCVTVLGPEPQINQTTKLCLPMNLILPSIFRLAMYLASSSMLVAYFSYWLAIWTRFSNSTRHLLSSNLLKVQALLSGGSKLGALSTSSLHICAYIDEYFGSSRAFSKICKLFGKWRDYQNIQKKRRRKWQPSLSQSAVRFLINCDLQSPSFIFFGSGLEARPLKENKMWDG